MRLADPVVVVVVNMQANVMTTDDVRTAHCLGSHSHSIGKSDRPSSTLFRSSTYIN
jgi:hypothetical protein